MPKDAPRIPSETNCADSSDYYVYHLEPTMHVKQESCPCASSAAIKYYLLLNTTLVLRSFIPDFGWQQHNAYVVLFCS